MKKLVLNFLLFVALPFLSMAQTYNITGTVIDNGDQFPIPGVTVVIKGSTTGTITDIDGKFSITANLGETLVFSFVGMETQEQVIVGANALNISMISSMVNLDELVVVGYGVQKKSLVTGSIAKVDEEALVQNKTLRLEQALQGKVSGVNISQSSGSPGADMKVTIRGVGSNGSSNALFVVDGIKVGGIEDLNPNDIESIEVLKDAYSASIYGSEAANGVVLITTKRGSKSKQGVASYNGYYGINSPTQMPDVLNAAEYINYFKEAHTHELAYKDWKKGIVIPYDDPTLVAKVNALVPYSADTINSTDWMKEIVTPATVISHNLSFSGGSEMSSYFLSLSYYNEDGIIGGDKSNFKRYTANLSGTQEVNDWLEVEGKLTYVNRENKNVSLNSEFGGIVSMASNIDPLTQVTVDSEYDLTPDVYLDPNKLKYVPKQGDRYYGLSKLITNEIANPVAWMDLTNSMNKQNKFLGRVGAKAKIIDGLVFNTSINVENWNSTYQDWKPGYYFHGLKKDTISYVQKDAQNGIKVFTDAYLSYAKSIGNNNFDAMLGTSYETYHDEGLGANNKRLRYDNANFAYLSQATQPDSLIPAPWDWYNESVMISYFGRANYNYKEKYMVSAILRSDGSNKFGPNNRFGYFPSVSLGYVISKEDFWNVPYVNFLKIRGSWGQNGSTSNLGNWSWTSTYSFGDARYPFNNSLVDGARPTQTSNYNLKWEKAEQLNFGFDAAAFENRIVFSTDIYSKTTVDLLLDATPPLYVGNKPPKVNAGNIQNKGIEFDLTLNENIGEFKLSVNANASYLKNNVKELTEGFTFYNGASVATGQGNVNRFEEGYPAWYFWGYQTDGFFANTDEISAYTNADGDMYQSKAIPGDVKFKDVNGIDADGNLTGIPDGKIDENDKVMLGQPYPKWNYGFNFTVEWRGLDVAMLLQASTGNSVYNGSYRPDLKTNNKPQYFYDDRWDMENPTSSGDWMRPTYNDGNTNYRPSDLFVENASFLKFRQAMVGYTIPHSFTERINISKLRVYVSMDNILTITKYKGGDPEVGQLDGWAANVGIDRGFYPTARSVKFGVNINF